MHFYAVWRICWTGVAAVNTSGNCKWPFVFQHMNVVSQHGGHVGSVRAAMGSKWHYLHYSSPLTEMGNALWKPNQEPSGEPEHDFSMIWLFTCFDKQAFRFWITQKQSGHFYQQTLIKVVFWHFPLLAFLLRVRWEDQHHSHMCQF